MSKSCSLSFLREDSDEFYTLTLPVAVRCRFVGGISTDWSTVPRSQNYRSFKWLELVLDSG